MIINETPIRTARNFKINNITLEDVCIPEKINKFNNISIKNTSEKIKITDNVSCFDLEYGLSNILTDQVKTFANQKLKIDIDSKKNEEVQIEFSIDKKNKALIDNIEIEAKDNSKATIIIKYNTLENIKGFHNGIIKLFAKENSKINIIIVNFMNTKSQNFLAIDNKILKNAIVNYTIVDFGGKNSISNLYSSLEGDLSTNNINTIYLGKENQLFDINYIGHLKGEKTNIDINVQGALTNKSKKHFKGTIDFKKGCKKAKGNENEECMLLSEDAKSIALPILLCEEEDVEGNHSSSAGKIGEKELFYIMTRGFSLKEAMKLMVRAKFNKVIKNIKNKDLQNEVLDKIDNMIN